MSVFAVGQTVISGVVSDQEQHPLPFTNVLLKGTTIGAVSDEEGRFELTTARVGEAELLVSFVGYLTHSEDVELNGNSIHLSILLTPSPELDEVVVTGTLKEMSRKESPVPVEVYSPAFFKKNPSPSLYESMHNVNGVRPQLNCNVCNTGDIHINGLEGPYTMVMIDGMPIVSGLSTVYGLMGIPNSMVERIEIVKGPASSLYGSEAIGGLINVITKDPSSHARFYGEVMTTSWLESQADLGFKSSIGKSDVLTGVHLFSYQNPIDDNGDNFTDVTLSQRISVFQKWNFKRKHQRLFTIGGRYYYEDRWGGEMQWTPAFRGGDSIYGESILTNRVELLSKYQLPVSERFMLSTSFNHHDQNSYYGDMSYMATQDIAFGQLTWDKTFGVHNLTTGSAFRYTRYDDNTVATEDSVGNRVFNRVDESILPGVFVQNDMVLSESTRILVGLRYDHHNAHGNIWTPRFAYKWTINDKNSIRLNAGTGFRVVSVFTEDHAALTGARDVIIQEDLDPERSYNANLNYLKKIYSNGGDYWGIDLSAFYSHFTNKIIPDYDTDPNLIIYKNLDGFAVSQGFTVNIDALIRRNWKFMAGVTYTDVYAMEQNEAGGLDRINPVLTEEWSGMWSMSYTLPKIRTVFDYTGVLYGPMRLPLLGALDPRAAYSPWWSLQNIQVTYKTGNDVWEIFGGVKNLLNYTPPANSIARANDPFDKDVQFDSNGDVIPTDNNPYALTFDPSYVYAPNQGMRFFAGLRINIQ